MSRETSPCIDGDFWLDKRRDGKSPHVWQITRYDAGSRSDVYRSTKRRTLDEAKPILHAHAASERAKGKQDAADAQVIPQLILYIRENPQIDSIAQTKSSVRAFMGFLMQDAETGLNVTFAGLTANVWKRFIAWRMGPHFYSVQWGDKTFTHESPGIRGESVQRNLDDIRAGINHAVSEERVPMAPKVPSVARKHRSRPRNTRLSIKQMGAIVGYAAVDRDVLRWLDLMIATVCRPEAGLAFDPATQDHGELLDMHPADWPYTDKVNPWVPAIVPLRPILDAWKADPHRPVRSRKVWWRTMRAALGLPVAVIPKTIRHSIATEMRLRGVPGGEISGMMGHHDPDMDRTSGVYAKYDPAYLGKAKRALTKIWTEIHAAADSWSADHLRTIPVRGAAISVVRKDGKAYKPCL